MKFKSIISLILVAFIMASLIGCEKKNTGSNNNVDNTTDKETSLSWEEIKATIPKDAAGKTIEIYDWNEIGAVAQAKKVLDNFTKETGIKYTWTVESYDTYSTKLAARVASGSSPDLIRVREEVPSWYKYLQPITNSGYNFNDSAWDKRVMKSYTFNGKVYAVNMADSPYYYPMVTIYNSNLIEKYGLEDPYTLWKDGKWTWDKMHEIAEKFVKAAGSGYYGITSTFGEYAYSIGCPPVSFDGQKYVSNLSHPQTVKAWQYMNTAYQKGIYDKTIMDVNGMNSGKVLFGMLAEIGLRKGHFYIRELKNKGYAKAVPIPAVDGQEEYYQIVAENGAFGIPQGAKNLEIAPYLLRYMLDRNNYDMTNFYYDGKDGEGSILEVVDYTRTLNKVSALSTMMWKDTTNYNNGWYCQHLLTCGTAQIKSEMDRTFVTGMKNAIEQANKEVSRMK